MTCTILIGDVRAELRAARRPAQEDLFGEAA
jgi:hypothetical protein